MPWMSDIHLSILLYVHTGGPAAAPFNATQLHPNHWAMLNFAGLFSPHSAGLLLHQPGNSSLERGCICMLFPCFVPCIQGTKLRSTHHRQLQMSM